MVLVVFILIVHFYFNIFPLPIDCIPLGYGNETSTNSTKDDITELKYQMAALSQIVHAMERKLESLQVKTTVENLPTYVDQSDAISPDMRAPDSNVVGFTAVLKDHVFDLPHGSAVIYDKVFYNAGNGYDTSTGIFTCPVTGIYMFYINVEPVDETLSASVAILINGSYRVAAVAERYDANHDSTGGNMLIEHIQEGDRVWVETYLNDNQDLFKGFTSFSGVLIETT